jgi:WD repeat-containing protein 35
MVNKRDNTIVTGMKWSSDGQQICIIYNDGVSIMGSLEGNRVWVKELKHSVLTNIEVVPFFVIEYFVSKEARFDVLFLLKKWAPDKRILLFGLASGEVHMFDFNGNFLVRKLDCCVHFCTGKFTIEGN